VSAIESGRNSDGYDFEVFCKPCNVVQRARAVSAKHVGTERETLLVETVAHDCDGWKNRRRIYRVTPPVRGGKRGKKNGRP